MKMNSKAPFILYGGDYNPDQWDDEIIEKDMEYFRKAGVNLVTLPVFHGQNWNRRKGGMNLNG